MSQITIKVLQVEKPAGKQHHKVRIAQVIKEPNLKTNTIPLDLVRNLMSLHNEAIPGSVKDFTTKFIELGCGDEMINEVIAPQEPDLDLQDPERTMLAFYKYSFLQNDDANN